ncbi:hypothetical protein [Kribbella sp. NPDC048915]|uniref:hypothetical protein n=1 Tax=Kribbella sp. NPDC048915 TaxID=3155148 RepID=UPI0033CE7C77
MDEVKKLLEGFADRAAAALPEPDIDADITRGRLALRRIKRRRRVTGVLCVAAASALVLAIGNQVKGPGTGDEVAGGTVESEQSAATSAPARSATPQKQETLSMYGATVVELVANKQPWDGIACTLAPKGFSAETPGADGRVVLSKPEMRTADSAAKVVLHPAPQARTLSQVRVAEASGRTFQIGTANGRLTGQVELDGRWLLLELPTGTEEWPDDVVRRFLASCTVK